MGKNRAKLGASVGKSLGYTIRMIVTGKTNEKTKKTEKIHTGKYGVYAGKNLIQDNLKNILEAMETINKVAKK